METKVLLERLSDKMRDLSVTADWYDSMHAQGLSELYRYAQKNVCEFIDLVRARDYDSIDEWVGEFNITRYCLFNQYKYYQKEHFDHLAELSIFGYYTLGDLEIIIRTSLMSENDSSADN